MPQISPPTTVSQTERKLPKLLENRSRNVKIVYGAFLVATSVILLSSMMHNTSVAKDSSRLTPMNSKKKKDLWDDFDPSAFP